VFVRVSARARFVSLVIDACERAQADMWAREMGGMVGQACSVMLVVPEGMGRHDVELLCDVLLSRMGFRSLSLQQARRLCLPHPHSSTHTRLYTDTQRVMHTHRHSPTHTRTLTRTQRVMHTHTTSHAHAPTRAPTHAFVPPIDAQEH
jgi:hypothetical protein